LPDEEPLLDVEVDPELEPDEEEPEEEPESRGTAEPTDGESAGRERSCAKAGVRLIANAAAAKPIANLLRIMTRPSGILPHRRLGGGGACKQ
jgi:hypothetical protein